MLVKLNLSGHANQALADQGFEFPGALHVDLADPDLPSKVVEFLRDWIDSGDRVMVALPGLSPLAAIVMVAIHGLSGNFPILVPLVRVEHGFVPGPELDLQDFRNDVGRTSRQNTIKL